MDLDLIEIVTYVCAGLGVTLLFLCIIMAMIIIIGLCKKNFGRQSQSYSVVPVVRDPLDLEQAVLQRYHVNNDAVKGLSGLRLIDEVDDGVKATRNSAPVKRKLFWKKKKDEKSSIVADNAEDSRFSDEELNAGKPKHFFKKKKQNYNAIRKKSKSDWYIYARSRPDDGPHQESDEDEHEALLYPHQVISLIGSPVRPEELRQSQYFDALETIREEEHEEPDQPDNLSETSDQPDNAQRTSDQLDNDDWIDISDDEEEEEGESEKPKAKRKIGKLVYPESVMRRIKALKKVQCETEKLESQFYRELFYLESDFNRKFRKPIYDRRFEIVNLIDMHGSIGIENFWLQAMQNCDTLKDIIQVHDVPILKFLTDVRVAMPKPTPEQKRLLNEEHFNFRIDFRFDEKNPFFENEILTKEYFLKCEPEPNLPFTFDGPEVVSCRGCKINWRKGRNVTLQPVKKLNKETGELVTKFAKRNSFFNFFTPPKTAREWILDPKKADLMEAHFEIGLFFKETFVSRAIVFYANHSVQNLVEDDPSFVSTRKKFGTKQEQRIVKMKKSNSFVKRPDSGLSQASEFSETTNDETSISNRSDDANQNTRAWYQLKNGVSPNSTIAKDVKQSQGPDPIIGRYRLVSSEGFDDFLKCLGVGMVRRKLANSVTPVVVVDVDSNGLHTIRTESQVSTSEQKFRLNETFEETTLDGRVVKTTPTRCGNVLVLDQEGDPSRGSKSTKLIRDFQGETMILTMSVDDVICKRFFQKVQD